jgi:hypothetical protein
MITIRFSFLFSNFNEKMFYSKGMEVSAQLDN